MKRECYTATRNRVTKLPARDAGGLEVVVIFAFVSASLEFTVSLSDWRVCFYGQHLPAKGDIRDPTFSRERARVGRSCPASSAASIVQS